MAGHPDDDYNRDILDIIPERFDADPGDYAPPAGHRLRNWLILGGAVLAVGVAVAVGWRLFAGGGGGANGIPTITADQRPLKVRPDDRGGMQVPNQDKLVYGRLEQGDGDAKVERLLPAAEQPLPPPPSPPEAAKPPAPAQEVLKPPALVKPEPAAAPVPAPVAVPAKPAEPVPAAPAVAATKPAAAPVPAPAAAAKPAAVQPAPALPPAPAAKPAAVPAAPPVATAPAKSAAVPGGDYLVQLGALRSAPDADKEWGRIHRANGDVLGGLKSDVIQVDLGAKGVFWRLRAGPLSEQSARQVCAELKNRNQGCMVVRK